MWNIPILLEYKCGFLSSSLMNCQRWMFDLPARTGDEVPGAVIIGVCTDLAEETGSVPKHKISFLIAGLSHKKVNSLLRTTSLTRLALVFCKSSNDSKSNKTLFLKMCCVCVNQLLDEFRITKAANLMLAYLPLQQQYWQGHLRLFLSTQ